VALGQVVAGVRVRRVAMGVIFTGTHGTSTIVDYYYRVLNSSLTVSTVKISITSTYPAYVDRYP